MSSYSYSVVDSAGGQIRLLKLDFDWDRQCQRPTSKPLSGSLTSHYFPLPPGEGPPGLSRRQILLRGTQLPIYCCLSYVWGASNKTHHILIDGKNLAITKNLYQALCAIQGTYSDGHPYCWVDAICVNQEDKDERGAQVKFMEHIFSGAMGVLIWLGPGTQETKRCARFIYDLTHKTHYDLEGTDKGKLDFAWTQSPLRPMATSILKGITNVGHAAIASGLMRKHRAPRKGDIALSEASDQKNLLKWRPSKRQLRRVEISEGEDLSEIASIMQRVFVQNIWFSRMWVVQELGVSSYSAAFLMESCYIYWESTVRAIHYLGCENKLQIPNIRWILGLEKIRHAWCNNINYPLQDLIRECRHRQSSDPRDKIYSLLGLMHDDIDAYLTPRYRDPVGKVFADATIHNILRVNSLDPLCSWQTRGRRDDPAWQLPSWTPDYTLDQELAPSSLTPIDSIYPESIFAASGYDFQSNLMLPETPSESTWSILRVQGICIDSISVLSEVINEDEDFHLLEKRWYSTILASSSLAGLADQHISSLTQLSWLIESYADYSSKRPSVRIFEDLKLQFSAYQDPAVNAYFNALFSGRLSSTERLTDKHVQAILTGRESKEPLLDNTTPLEMEFISKVCKALEAGLKRRRLVITVNGYIGSVPEESEKDDLLCVLYGASVPVVLRKRTDEDTYQFIGAAYLHGFMDAEAIAMQKQGILTRDEFVLH